MNLTSSNTRIVGAALLAVAALAVAPRAQAIGKDEYRTIFSDVIRKSLDDRKTDNVCLPPLFGFGENATPTVDVVVDSDVPVPVLANRAAQFKALESVGLVSGVEGEKTVAGKTQKFITYRRTPMGATFFSGVTFCYAKAGLDRVVKWKGPIVLGEYKAAFVYYTVKTSNVAEWARAPAVVAAFPTIAPILSGAPAKERQVAIDLSSEGWDVAEYSKLLQLQ